ncbi:MAG: hypothetical protein F6J93_11175 [Oscillatoria sp. SIO1A7]|nr:hypothetical protein [Oscillatoria sp. SIO1A7]
MAAPSQSGRARGCLQHRAIILLPLILHHKENVFLGDLPFSCLVKTASIASQFSMPKEAVISVSSQQ